MGGYIDIIIHALVIRFLTAASISSARPLSTRAKSALVKLVFRH